MFSLRAATRVAPRATLFRVSSSAVRRSPAASALVKSTSTSARPLHISAFSPSVLRRTPSGEIDAELSTKLASELEFEQEAKDSEPSPASIRDFMENGPFEIEDVPGKEEVFLKRTFGNEKITISFSISDMHNYDNPYEQDNALGDEEIDEQARDSNQRQRLRDRDGEEEGEGMEDEVDEGPVPAHLNIVIEKVGKGALNIEAMAQEGSIIIENLYFFDNPNMALSTDAEADFKSRDLYSGPPFGSLDEDLQIIVERYLEERGISTALANFIPDYMEQKEQKEYLSWLTKVKAFVDA